MTKIECLLFGVPEIKEDGKDVYIPMGKVSAVVYYLILKKVASRDELASIFWPTSNEDRAKTSLRNALHKIRKLFNEELLLTPNKSMIVLNEDVKIVTDVEEFEKNPIEHLDLYKDEFLKGFYVKDSAEFENWCMELRSYYKELFVKSIEKRIQNNYENKEYKNLVVDIDKLLSIDNFSEKAYYYLMKYYEANGRYDKVINEYYRYRKLMREELGISPSEIIESTYKKATSKIDGALEFKKNEDKNNFQDSKKNFYGREYEMDLMQQNINKFKRDEESKSILITGEYGIGKTIIKNEIIKENKRDFKLFEVPCYSVDRNYSYYPWIKLLSMINGEIRKSGSKIPLLWDELLNNFFFNGNDSLQPTVQIFEMREKFNTNLMYNSLINAFELLSQEKKIIIVFEDIQWLDMPSMELLNRLMLHSGGNVMFILTQSDDDEDYEENNFAALMDLDKILKINLKLFDKRDVTAIIKFSIGDGVSEEEINYIFEKSRGNAFFLSEYLELYKNKKAEDFLIVKTSNVLQEKFSRLSDIEINILDILSVFHGNISIEFLTELLNINAFDVLKSINNLIKKKIIEEIKTNGKIYLAYTYNAYQQYIYSELSDTSKQILNLEIAKSLEKELLIDSGDITSYVKLQHHYSEANEPVKALKYEVNILNYYMSFNHELFPDLTNYAQTENSNFYLNNDKAMEWMNEIESRIIQEKNLNKRKERDKEIEEVELMFLYCKGRYYIRGGRYNEGIKVMQRVINLAKELGDDLYKLSGHKQMIIYGVQINKTSIMLNHIIEGIKVAKTLNIDHELGILYRLYGLYYLMKGDFKSAENLFHQAIDMFNNSGRLEKVNPVSVAAVYNYLGEIRSAELEYEKALEFFKQGIHLTEGLDATCLAIFYINAGKTNFLMGNYDEMKSYIVLAQKVVRQFDSYWKTPVLDSLVSLVQFLEGNYTDSLQNLKLANTEAKIINNPRDIGMVNFVSAIISMKLKDVEDENSEKLKEYLSESPDIYYYDSIKFLDSNRDKGEIEYLKNNILEGSKK